MKPAVVSMASTSYGVIAGKAGRDFSAQIGTAVLAAAATVALVISVGFVDEFSSSRLMAALIAMIAAHVLICPRLFFSREVALYGAFVAYSYVTLLWTQNLALAANTLTPIVNFLLVLLMFGSLVAFHDLRAVAAGLLLGFLSGAALYTGIVGFPFSYPADFSYNAIAGMYLFGLFVAILAGWVTRAKVLPLLLAVVFLILIASTTSIKTNLGILIGAAVAIAVYYRTLIRTLGRNAILKVVLACVGAYGVALSSTAIEERLEYAVTRLSTGMRVLVAREDVPGYSGFGERRYWMQEGIDGWLRNPLFGYGVEAFRGRVGATSHSTPVDLMYNAGLIGLVLFYSIFVSILLRLNRSPSIGARPLEATILAMLVCNAFVSLSATAHYSASLAAFVGIVVPLLARAGRVAEVRW